MKNTKEIKSLATAIFCLNRISENEDKDITLILDYFFRTVFNSNTNLLLMACVAPKDEVRASVFELLRQDTNYMEYLEEYKNG